MPPKPRRSDPRITAKQQLKERLQKKVAIKKGEKKICLTMIVKNEGPHMVRLFDSLYNPRTKSYVMDYISIVDTGSETAETENVILEWGKSHGIPTAVHHELFRNFGYNRTHSYRMAIETFPDLDYMLLADADFVFKVESFNKSLLFHEKYLLKQSNGSMSYWNIRLISGKVLWDCLCPTHEFISESKSMKQPFQGEVRTGRVSTLWISDLEDSLCRTDKKTGEGKYERDIRLLTAAIEDPATDPKLLSRLVFYQGNSYRDAGSPLEAIPIYEKRIAMGGWAEEVYHSMYSRGQCLERVGWNLRHCLTLMGKSEKSEEDEKYLTRWNPDNLQPPAISKQVKQYFRDAITGYLAGYKYRKTRAESLLAASRLYRSLGQNEQCYELCQIGKKIPYPHADTLFIEDFAHENGYLWDVEISIVAFYIPGKKEEGAEACARLLSNDKLPAHLRKQAEDNSRHYI